MNETRITFNDRKHIWHVYLGYTCCNICGMIKRRDSKNKPCKGAKIRDIKIREGK